MIANSLDAANRRHHPARKPVKRPRFAHLPLLIIEQGFTPSYVPLIDAATTVTPDAVIAVWILRLI
jgi:hypothetical protein